MSADCPVARPAPAFAVAGFPISAADHDAVALAISDDLALVGSLMRLYRFSSIEATDYLTFCKSRVDGGDK